MKRIRCHLTENKKTQQRCNLRHRLRGIESLEVRNLMAVSIGDYVWNDSNADGIQNEPSSAGQNGVEVRLFSVDGQQVGNPTQTANDTSGNPGYYAFHDVPNGSYYVQFTRPDGKAFVQPFAGTDTNLDSNVDLKGKSNVFAIASGTPNLSIDAGLIPEAKIGSIVWWDQLTSSGLGVDGLQQDLEPGIFGAQVRLLQNSQVIDTTVTTVGGQYAFNGLRPGTYQVQFVLPPGFDLASPANVPSQANNDDVDDSDGEGADLITAPLTLALGQTNLTVDQGFYTTTPKIGNYVWRDENSNGIQDEPASSGVNGVTVTLFSVDNSGNTTQVGNSVVTSNDSFGNPGYYVFTGVVAGSYLVEFRPAVGERFTTREAGFFSDNDSNVFPDTGRSEVFQSIAGDFSIDAGLLPAVDLSLTASVSELFPLVNENVTYTFTVSNAAGTSTATGITVTDLLPSGVQYVSHVGVSNYNSATDILTIPTLAPGTSATVQITATVLTPGAKANLAQVTTTDQFDLDSTPGNAATRREDDDASLTITPSSLIGNYVWRDRNNNGIQDESVSDGINGVVVRLFRSDGTQVGGPAVTANDNSGNPGYYSFNRVIPGNYFIRFEAPAGQVFTARAIGSGSSDSDADSTGTTPNFVVVSGINDISIDAGLRPIDLALTASVTNLTPSINDVITYVLDLSNGTSFSAATGVVVTDVIPPGYEYVSDNASGAYNSTTRTWTVGTVAPGATRSLNVVVRVTTPGSKTNVGQVQAADQPDIDSSPNNAATISEDDNFTITVVPSSRVGGYVWRDVNNNGIDDEPANLGINGVTVTLFTSAGVQVGLPVVTANDATNNPGFYLFGDIDPGSYYLVFAAPTGQVFTTPKVGLPATDSDVDANGRTSNFTLSSGIDDLSIFAGIRPVDLSITSSASDTSPPIGTQVTYTVTVSNQSGLSAATGVVVSNVLPTGVTYVSDNAAGAYNSATRTWSVGTVAPGASVTLTVTATVAAAGPLVNQVQVQAATEPDLDSTPGNAATVREDDDVIVTVVPSSRIGDYVWLDSNNNGIQDEPATAGVNGVTVRLFTSANVQVGLQVTTANDSLGRPGYYQFTDINPGSYYVVFTAPSGQTFTTPFVGAAATDSNVDAAGRSNTFTLASGVDDLSIDAGISNPISCATFDFNGNTATSGTVGNVLTYNSGAFSVKARGFSRDRVSGAWAAAYVGSYGGGLGVTDTSEGTGDGDKHTVDNLDGRNNYIVLEFNQPVVIDSALLGYVVGDSDLSVWIGTIPNAFNVPQALSDALLSGFYFESNGTTLTTARTADLNATGILGNVVVIAADVLESIPEDRFKLGNVVVCRPGAQSPASIGDTVWHDLNANGIRESTEPGISGASVTLVGGGADGVINGVGDTTVTTSTNATGAYSFTGLVPGTQYRVSFATPTDFTTPSPQRVGTDRTVDSDGPVSGTFILASGQNLSTVDAGFFRDVRIGNYVWNDLDADGIQDSNEQGIAGVSLRLSGTAGSGVAVNRTTTTSSAGAYEFAALPPGTYQVTVDAANFAPGRPLSGFVASPTLVGTDRNLDSNISPSATSPATLASGGTDLSIDFGYNFVMARTCVNLYFEGNTPTSGAAGNVLTFSSNGISAKASAFSRETSGAWAPAYLGRFPGGLGVTDGSEGSGAGNAHTVDNIGRMNYVLFTFSQSVTVDTAYLGYIAGDSDMRVWIGNVNNAFNVQNTLSDAYLSGLGLTEVNLGAGSTRLADLNAGNVAGNVLVIAALPGEANDQFKIGDLGVCAMVNPSTITNKFFTVDDDTNRTVRYDSVGNFIQDFALVPTTPRGITANVAGNTVWVADYSGRIFRYSNTGVHHSNWNSRISGLQGVTTDGTNIWTVSETTDRVYFYANGANAANGATVTPHSSFALNAYNRSPTDITTDGRFIWVVNDGGVGTSGDMVFKYTTGGRYLGRWQLDPANSRPTGITTDPAGSNRLWVVDSGTDRVYEYSGATGAVSGGLVAWRSFALAASNRNPQGLADPSDELAGETFVESSTTVNEQFVNNDVNPNYNSFSATDVNSDGRTSPLDALLVINRLHAVRRGDATNGDGPWLFVDVNNDGRLSPVDALMVINRLHANLANGASSDSGTPTDEGSSTEDSTADGTVGNAEGESPTLAHANTDAFFASYDMHTGYVKDEYGSPSDSDGQPYLNRRRWGRMR